jgi:hypothetical protein
MFLTVVFFSPTNPVIGALLRDCLLNQFCETLGTLANSGLARFNFWCLLSAHKLCVVFLQTAI